MRRRKFLNRVNSFVVFGGGRLSAIVIPLRRTALYEMSLLEAASGSLSLVVMFQELAHITVYADESKQGGVVIVAIEARRASGPILPSTT